MEDQFWQNSLNVDTFDFSSNLESSYRVKIEGRLLDDEYELEADEEDRKTGENETDGDKMDTDTPSKPKPKPAPAPAKRPRLSHFFKALTIDFDKQKPGRQGSETSVEWKKPDRTPAGAGNLPAMADFDEFTFKRNGDENMNITINLFRHEDPERFELSPELAEIIDMREATRQEAVMAVWEYIKLRNLQEDEEKRNFRCDDLLRKVCLTLFPCSPSRSSFLIANTLLPRSSPAKQATSPTSTSTSPRTCGRFRPSSWPTRSASTRTSTKPHSPPSTTCAWPSTTRSAPSSCPSSRTRSTPPCSRTWPRSTSSWPP